VSVAIIHNHPIHYKHLLFSELTKMGLEFEVLFMASASSLRKERIPLNRDLYRYRIGYDGPYQKAPWMHTIKFIWKSLNDLDPSVVIISGWADVAAWTAWVWALGHGRGRILWAESNVFDHPRHWRKELVKRLFVKRCDCAHVYGASNREYLEKLGMPRERIYIKRAVADTDLFLKEPALPAEKPDRTILLYCGRFSREKNLAMLFRALAKAGQEAGRPQLSLKLVGYGPLEDSLRQLAVDLGIAGLVEFAGKACQAELPQIFRRADVLILPSTSEPWGLVVNEGMLSGMAVAVSDRCGCAADLVTPETGWTFSPYDETALTRLLVKIAETPRSELERMGSSARLLGSSYSPQNCAKIVMESVNQFLGESSFPETRLHRRPEIVNQEGEMKKEIRL